MLRLVKAEWMKQKKNRLMINLNVVIMLIIVGLYVWSAFAANEGALQPKLRQVSCAGAYGVTLFTTLCRKIWAILYGFAMVNMEFIENRCDFFVQNAKRWKMWLAKFLYGSVLAMLIICLTYVIPAGIAFITSGRFDINISGSTLFAQLLIVWMMTIGNILLGMWLALVVNDMIIIAILVLTLEFFSNIYPNFILKIWEKIDGYWYISSFLSPMKQELLGLNKFYFSLSNCSLGVNGFFVWGSIVMGMIIISCYMFLKKEF